ncbi:MAG TPA: FkbM family methyltransferase [Candidatus Polarisedimenticolia bacterium]
MKLFPGNLFISLVKELKADCVCDVGSMDGREALRFRTALPDAAVFAFEANPHNFRAIEGDPEIASAGIRLVQAAAAAADGTLAFNIADVDYNDREANRGLSSLMIGETAVRETINVKSLRLDRFLSAAGHFTRIALWVDVEGAAFEALLGSEGILQRVCCIHTEVETRAFFKGQKTFDEVKQFLCDRGFIETASEFWLEEGQGNVLFIRDVSPARLFKCKVRATIISLLLLASEPFKKAAQFLLGRSVYSGLKRFYLRRLV